MNSFDFEIMSYVFQFSQHSEIFTKLIVMFSGSSVLKGGVLAALIWWAWFKREERQSLDREQLISSLLGCVVAMALARTLAMILPFRNRPRVEEGLSSLHSFGGTSSSLDTWSSFPSDHAVFFFTLAVGLFFVHRRVGIFAIFYSILFISFPRLYLGLHYPTDLIAGAIIGTAIALIANIYLVKNKNIHTITQLSYSKPGLFYPLFLLFTSQIADMFDGTRDMIRGMYRLIQSIIT
jgi:undecaprenyl-diphosphatase